MQHTKIHQYKQQALELIDCVETDVLTNLLLTAHKSQESLDWEESETLEYISITQATREFLIRLEQLNDRCKIKLKHPKKTSENIWEYEATVLDFEALLKLVKQLFEIADPKKMVFDLWTLFVAAIDTNEFVNKRFELANIGFSIKLLTQFILDSEQFVQPIHQQEWAAIDCEEFMPLYLN